MRYTSSRLRRLCPYRRLNISPRAFRSLLLSGARKAGLLFVEDLDRSGLGGEALLCRMDHERPSVIGVASALDEASLLEAVEQFDHRCAVDLELGTEGALRHRLALDDQREDPDLTGAEADLREHLVGERVRCLGGSVEQERDARPHARRQLAIIGAIISHGDYQ